jgi:competence ComEA-like helix-hairpin-helix protein
VRSTHPNKTSSYFYFSKPERWAAFVLLVMIGMVMVLPKFLWQQKPDLLIPLALEQFGIDTMYMRDAYAAADVFPNKEPFVFDPNTASVEALQSLGFTAKLAATLDHYRAKGGVIRSGKDLYKIWGMPTFLADRLAPFVRAAGTNGKNSPSRPFGTAWTPRYAAAAPIDINTASVSDFEALSGIGPVLAARIVGFREKHGGFVKVQDLLLVYGVKDTLLRALGPYLRLDEGRVPKANLNQASAMQLIEKAGLQPVVAQALVRWRQQNGAFAKFDELENFEGLSAASMAALKRLFFIE